MKVEDTMMGREKMYSLTNAQKQIFEMSSYSEKNTASISIVLWMEEEYDERVLQETVDELIQRNDAFRIKIVNDNGIIKQYNCSIFDQLRIHTSMAPGYWLHACLKRSNSASAAFKLDAP